MIYIISSRQLSAQLAHLHEGLHAINHKVDLIMATQVQHAEELRQVTAKIVKIGTETAKTLQRVIDLEALLAAGGDTSEEVNEAVAALKVQAQLTDDLTPDSPV